MFQRFRMIVKAWNGLHEAQFVADGRAGPLSVTETGVFSLAGADNVEGPGLL